MSDVQGVRLAPRSTILNVNDRDENRYVITKILRNAGFQVIEATSGVKAVELARANAPDVVVLDVHLPDIDGMEVCRRLKADARTASSLVLHTSATYASIDTKVRGLDVGGDAFLAQPFSSQELVATVKALLRLRRVEVFQRRRAEEFAEADRRKDDFLAMLGHELRNPLNAIKMSHAITARYPVRDETERRARDVAVRQTEHLARLVHDLLDVSRVTRGKIALDRGIVDLTDLLKQVGAVADESIFRPRRQALALSLPAYPVPVDGDRARLEQVFTNLLDNASKYSGEGAHTTLELDVDAGESGLANAVVTIADQGRGIAPEQLAQVFNLFYQGDPTEERVGTGLGIGLTLVRSLIDSHGGTVAVRSEGRGRGSQFEVRLPTLAEAVEAAADDPRQTMTRQRRQERAARRVLIIEDNKDARDMVEALCRMWGYQVELARDGIEGLEKLVATKPDVALVDIGLPGIDGYEIARRVRAEGTCDVVKLIALTGYGLPEQREKALQAGFDLHVVKPIESDMLASLLDDPEATIAMLTDAPKSAPAS